MPATATATLRAIVARAIAAGDLPEAFAPGGREITVTTRRDGAVTFRSGLGDAEMIEILSRVPGSFAADLLRAANSSRGLSYSQEDWGHKLANDWLAQQQKKGAENSADSVEESNANPLFAAFDAARSKGAKRMKIKLQDCILKPSQSGDDVWVLDPHRQVENRWGTMTPAYLGKINRKVGIVGSFSDAVMAQVRSACENPAAVAAQYGHETGNCSFCSKELTDNRSVSVGYGPICAEKYGLPWG